MAYDNNNSGILARNDRKTTDKHPDFSGSCEIAGVQYWISGWVKEGKPGSKMQGNRFFSLAFKAKDAPAGGAPAGSAPAPARQAPPSRAPSPTPDAPAAQVHLGDDVPF
jgi:hypothetical protein